MGAWVGEGDRDGPWHGEQRRDVCGEEAVLIMVVVTPIYTREKVVLDYVHTCTHTCIRDYI